MTNIIDRFVDYTLACEQALLGALAARREKEGELATTSLDRKSRREILIGGDDISNDVITTGTCFSVFVYIRTRFRFALIHKIWQLSRRGATEELEWNTNSRASSPSFSRPAT